MARKQGITLKQNILRIFLDDIKTHNFLEWKIIINQNNGKKR